jgi:hypothetical protein
VEIHRPALTTNTASITSKKLVTTAWKIQFIAFLQPTGPTDNVAAVIFASLFTLSVRRERKTQALIGRIVT